MYAWSYLDGMGKYAKGRMSEIWQEVEVDWLACSRVYMTGTNLAEMAQQITTYACICMRIVRMRTRGDEEMEKKVTKLVKSYKQFNVAKRERNIIYFKPSVVNMYMYVICMIYLY